MMTPLDTLLHDLRTLQAELTSTGNALWHIKLALQRAHCEGHGENDFLPRRLHRLQDETQLQFENALAELRQIALKSLNLQFFVFNSPREVKTFQKIKQTLRYLQNAYMDCSLREALNVIL